ncbi:helix-turn-helix transcriptional regulator [Spirochaeta africana]|uniref:Transcriptional regulator containing an amidase domain and an AraC-type DNA-binding HTH domain n=1 Tax=Spirochaeta africana (strain ATCC 700263 / DSM 8902 / Z-7692) TaxID=889378 RepID=H9ULG9_SPIAZ|nr:AraC family transcriptional regulator [Spirochaeta africana]AFG38362.1 transcriptional regulator containing an amidase domain and an AraC-type DNA-binding HTH domain [Spirochaeta africana DSM 8902]
MTSLAILDVVYVHTMNKPSLVHWHSRTHAHGSQQFEFHYFLHGDGSFANGGTVRSISPGQLYLSQPGQVHQIRPRRLDRPLGYYATLFSVPLEHPVHEVLVDGEFRRRFPRRLQGAHRFVFADLKNAFLTDDRYMQQAGTYRLLSLVYELAADAPHGHPEDAGFNILVEQAIAYFQENLRRHVTLQDLQQALGVSREYLIRVFNRYAHTTPMRYFTQLKIEAASSMLVDTNLTLKEIAYELGFSSPFHLSRRFKEYTTLSPTEYRREYYRIAPTRYHTRLIDAPGDEGAGLLDQNRYWDDT